VDYVVMAIIDPTLDERGLKTIEEHFRIIYSYPLPKAEATILVTPPPNLVYTSNTGNLRCFEESLFAVNS
jgi:hypothetical protein